MSATTDFLILEIKPLCNQFFELNSKFYDLTTNKGCGTYIEGLVEWLRDMGYTKVGHLKKTGSGTQYNGHSHDGFLYREGDPTLYRHVDCIVNAESTDPTKPPAPGFGIDIPRYGEPDWMAEPNAPVPADSVPYVPYWGDPSSDKAMRTLMYDFSRKPETYNPGMGRWISRLVHSATLGPVKPSEGGEPLGFDGALNRHRPEWCQELGGLDSNVPVPDDFFPEYK